MPPMDEHQFNRKVTQAGFSIGHTTKHPYIEAPDGDTHLYAVAHKKGSKRYIKSHYVKSVKQFILSKGGTWS